MSCELRFVMLVCRHYHVCHFWNFMIMPSSGSILENLIISQTRNFAIGFLKLTRQCHSCSEKKTSIAFIMHKKLKNAVRIKPKSMAPSLPALLKGPRLSKSLFLTNFGGGVILTNVLSASLDRSTLTFVHGEGKRKGNSKLQYLVAICSCWCR